MTSNPLTQLSLSTRIMVNLALLLVIVVGMGMTTVWYADRFNTLTTWFLVTRRASEATPTP